MSHILNHNRTPFDFKIDRSESWDLFLDAGSFTYPSNDNGGTISRCLSVDIDTTNGDCVHFDNITSSVESVWEGAKNDGLVLSNIGFTGVDNGLITFDRERISNSDFTKLYTDSELSYGEYGKKMVFNKVSGNNGIFDYGNDIVEIDGVDCIRLSGGFYQGFFKSGDDYAVLPTNIGEGWGVDFTFKPLHDIPHEGTTLNDRHPENAGIFFYIGTRAENKWWKYYKTGAVFDRIANTYFTDDGYNGEPSYLSTLSSSISYFDDNDNYGIDEYFADAYGKETCKPDNVPVDCGCVKKKVEIGGCQKKCRQKNDYFLDAYRISSGDVCECSSSYNLSGDYTAGADTELDGNYIPSTKNGHSVGQPNIVEIETDNKFLIFDRTCEGMTADKWTDGTTALISDIRLNPKENYFTIYHRGCGGLTADMTWGKRNNLEYDMFSDLYRNAFALYVGKDGAIGYKYMVKNCGEGDDETPYYILKEETVPNTISFDEWNDIHVKFEPVGAAYPSCAESTSAHREMTISIYVGGKLKLVSRQIPQFNFRKLNDTEDKQEGVPFNMSLGGGTQGLCDVVYSDFTKLPSVVLPLEKEFGGSMYGYLKNFRFYTCALPFGQIMSNP